MDMIVFIFIFFIVVVGTVLSIILFREKTSSKKKEEAEKEPVKRKRYGRYAISADENGAHRKSKAEEIKEIKELLDSGAINEDDYEKMKREIIG